MQQIAIAIDDVLHLLPQTMATAILVNQQASICCNLLHVIFGEWLIPAYLETS